MKKTVLSTFLIIFILLVCLLMFAACSNTPDSPATNNDSNGSANNDQPGNNATPDGTHTHSFGAWNNTKDPTCTESGESTRTCSCGVTETTTLPALNHDEIIDSAIPSTCLGTGLTEGKHCGRCNTVLTPQNSIPALGHDEIIDPMKDPTCTEAGVTAGKHCERCSTVLVQQDPIPALTHVEIIDSAKPSSCLETGLTEGKHCGRCNTVLVPQNSTPALGHYEITDPAEAPSCTEPGLTAGKHCGRCQDILVAQTTVSATGHSLNSNSVCSGCGGDFSINMVNRVGSPISTTTHSEPFAWATYVSSGVVTDNLSHSVKSHWQAKNLSGKTIKYITVEVKYYNAVDDCVYTAEFKKTGPIDSGALIEMEMNIDGTNYRFYNATKKKKALTE